MKDFNLVKGAFSRRGFYQLILYAAILGIVVGLATSTFLLIEQSLTRLIWDTIPQFIGSVAFYTLFVCSVGGLLVGLCQQYLGDYPKPMRQALNDVRTQGSFETEHIPHAILAGLVSLCFGAALGPEAVLICLAGGLGSMVARQLKLSAQQAHNYTYFSVCGALGAFFQSPFGSAALAIESPEGNEIPSAWVMIPGVFAGLTGLVTTLFLSGDRLRVIYDYLPYQSPNNGTDFLLAIPLGALGALLGLIYLNFQSHLTNWIRHLFTKKLLRGLFGGAILGLLATYYPLVLFSGQVGINDLMINHAETGGGMLILIGLAKLLALSVCLSTGWKGGEIFPVMFSGAAIGLGIAHLIPIIHPMVGMVCVMTAATATMLRKPLATILIIILFMPATLIIPIVMSAVVGAAISIPKSFEKSK
jgi:H+/Cl- antiporter ClcA